MKDAYMPVCKSKFKFMKFHMLLHTPEQIRMLGNLDIVDANRYFCCFFWFFVGFNRSFLQRWEHFHVVAAKRVYALTQKRTKTVQADMERALARIEKNAYIFEQVFRKKPIFLNNTGFCCFCQMNITSYVKRNDGVPKYYSKLHNEETDVQHYWKAMSNGTSFSPTTIDATLTGLTAALAKTVEFYQFLSYCLIYSYFVPVPRTFL